jgi:predicted type IV restriction endonuclease
MRLNPDQASKNLEKISKIVLDNPTEADTRAKIIDPILRECLNWQEDDIFREEHANPGFVDYVLKIGSRNVLVIEAKKFGHSFKLPITFGLVRDYTLGGILKKEKSIADVIEQARRYCQDMGAKYGAISNGDQFIIFEKEKTGRPWTEANCKIFYSFDDVLNNFIAFWNLFSKDAIESGSLVNLLSAGSEELHFVKPVDDVKFRNEIEPRNELYRYLVPIISRTFKEMTQENQLEMLKDCYVIDPEEGDEVSNSLKSYMTFELGKFECKKIKQGEENAGIFHTDFYDKMEHAGNSTDPIICLLLGGVGSGKTTFVFRFFNVVLIEEEREKVKWFYVDFKNAPSDEKCIRDYIFKSIFEDFKRKYSELFLKCLDKTKIEKAEPTFEHIKAMLSALRDEGFVLSLVVDNVDQHIFQSSTFHESVFIEANNLSKELKTITIMTLREESFYKSSTGGPFDAYYIEQYRIMPPDLQSLLLLRLKYVQRKLKLPKTELQKWLCVGTTYNPPLDMISSFLASIEFTLEQKANRGVVRFVSGTSGGNMRRALELFANFLVSGNTKVKEIVETRNKVADTYIIAEHQFIKSIVLGNYRYYSKNSSYLMNIFDINQSFYQSHFLRLKILSFAEDQISVDSEYGSGFISINRLTEVGSEISITRQALEDALGLLARYSLIELNTRSKDDLKSASHFKITDSGVFFLRLLSRRFVYLDLVLADTPIADVDIAFRIRHLLPSRELNERFQRTELFVNYLIKMENKEFQDSPEYELNPLGKYRFAQNIKTGFEKEKKYILESQRKKNFLREQDWT